MDYTDKQIEQRRSVDVQRAKRAQRAIEEEKRRRATEEQREKEADDANGRERR